MGGPNTIHASEYGEPGFWKSEPISSEMPGNFVDLTDQVRAAQGTSTAKIEWVIRASDNTVLSYELFTANTETVSTLEFILRRNGVVVTPEVRSSVPRIFEFLQKEQLHTVAETLLDEHLNPPAP
ncbi:MAG: hypothetical protein H8D97_01430 [Proteobacteria bacterium]|nr:hypothetical protein [Pseudomonadota bacterium]